MSAYSQGFDKTIAPMAFVYAPVLLFVSSTGFDLAVFSYTALSCTAGVFILFAAVIGYWLAPLNAIERILAAFVGLVFIALSRHADFFSVSLLASVIIWKIWKVKHQQQNEWDLKDGFSIRLGHLIFISLTSRLFRHTNLTTGIAQIYIK